MLMALFREKKENVEMSDHGIGNLSLSQSDSPLVDIPFSLLNDKENYLRPSIKITKTSTTNNTS